MAAAAPFCSASVPLTPTKAKATAHFPSSSPSPSARSSGFLRSKCRKLGPLSAGHPRCYVSASGSSSSTDPSAFPPAFRSGKKLYVSGLSFRTTEESLRDAFDNFGELVEVNLVMDKIANRPRGFAFLRYATNEESQRAIEGMHGKFLDGRVIFVEVAKPRSELRQSPRQPPR